MNPEVCTNDNCLNEAMHQIRVPNSDTTPWTWTKRNICCICYINEGNPPADWHGDCMREYDRQRKAEPPPIHAA